MTAPPAVDRGGGPKARNRSPDRALHIEWDVDTCGPVVLVSIELENRTAATQSVRVENRLDGPVLPPRRRGVAERGWDARGFAGQVSAGERLALGYACPLRTATAGSETAASDEPPVDVALDPQESTAERSATPAAVVRDLGDPRPPADAVPAASTPIDRESDTDPTDDSARDRSNEERAALAWFDAVEERIERAERLDGASIAEATAVLRDCGGVGAVEAEARQLRRDARELEEIAARANALSARIDSVESPVDALGRLA